MNNEILAENLIFVLPKLTKKLCRAFPTGVTKQQLELLIWVYMKEGQTMSYYSENTLNSKPNLTVIADKLMKSNLLERGFNPNDRRTITLHLTEKGREFLDEYKKNLKISLVKIFDDLDSDDLEKLNTILELSKQILKKIPN
jgi:DNA-binding MarR family transcriptional regulator